MQVHPLGQQDPQEKGMATHSSILVWRIPWTEEPGGLQSKGFQRVGQDCSDLARTHVQSPDSSSIQNTSAEGNSWRRTQM